MLLYIKWYTPRLKETEDTRGHDANRKGRKTDRKKKNECRIICIFAWDSLASH
jgi:hypothetical protein